MKYSPSSEDSKLVRNVFVASLGAELCNRPIPNDDIHISEQTQQAIDANKSSTNF